MAVSACYAKEHPLDRCNLATCGASVNFGCDEGMFDYWMRDFSNVRSYTPAKRFTYMEELIGDVVYTIADLNFASKPTSAEIEGQVFVVEAKGAETSRVRLVEIQSPSGKAPFYDQTLVRGSETALKVAKDAPTRLLLQSFVTTDFASAGFLLRPWPSDGIPGRNTRLYSVFDDETPFALDVAFVGGSDALEKFHKYHAPCGGKISGASSALDFHGDANTVHAYIQTAGPFQPVLFADTRSLFMSSAAAALGESEPFERLDSRRVGRDRIKLEPGTPSTLMIDQGGSRGQQGLITSLVESVQHEYDDAGQVPMYATGSDEVPTLLPRIVEGIGIVIVASGADGARPRVYPSEPQSKKPSSAVSRMAPTRTEPPPTRSGHKSTAPKYVPKPKPVPKKRALPDPAPAKASAKFVPQLQKLTDDLVAASDNGGVLYPVLASAVEAKYVPVGLLDDSDAEPLDLSEVEKLIYDELERAEKRKWPSGKPEFVWATSVVGVQPVTYDFDPKPTRYHIIAIQGTSLKMINLILEPVGTASVSDREKGTINPKVANLTLDKLKTRIAFATKRDEDDLYVQDGSDRGAEVVWKAINAYIALGPKRRPKTSK